MKKHRNKNLEGLKEIYTMLFRRQTSEPTSGPGGNVNITKITPNSPVQSSPTSGPPPSNLLTQWYTKITTNVKKRQNFSPKTLLKKALVIEIKSFFFFSIYIKNNQYNQ